MAENQTIPIRRSVVPGFVTQAASDIPQKQEIKYPSEVIPLPTKGWFYPEDNVLSSGEIEIKQMTAREEDLLANQDLIRRGKVLDKLLEALIVNKSVKIDEILAPDKNAIFISIRRLAYGDEYPISVTCPQCSKQNKVVINLASLETNPFDFTNYTKGVNSFSFTLPASNIVITYKLLTQVDEQSIESELKELTKVSKESSKELTTRLKYVITSLNGDPDKMKIRKFIEDQLTARDSFALRKHMRDNKPDIDMSFDFKCNDCTFERRLDIPIGVSFLWPDVEA